MTFAYNMDCLEAMRDMDDKAFDLAVVDPPYGIGIQSMTFTKGGRRVDGRKACAKKRDYSSTAAWDVRPPAEYFEQLMRVSKAQIIWGGQLLYRYIAPVKKLYCMG